MKTVWEEKESEADAMVRQEQEAIDALYAQLTSMKDGSKQKADTK